MLLLLEKFKSTLFLLGAVILVLFGAYAAGGRAARRAAESDRTAAELRGVKQARRTRQDVEKDIQQRPAGDALDRLRDDWSRD